jgi:murein DD-endopeptidase MepM/ murein hydrolase activator NlpD
LKRIHTGYAFIFLFLMIFPLQRVRAEELSIIQIKGSVWLKEQNLPAVRIQKVITISSGSYIKTGRDSEVVIKSPSSYYKLYAYSRVYIQSEPSLIYGKLSQSKARQFLDLRFFFTPQWVQGKTVKVVVRSSSHISRIGATIYNESGYRNTLTFYALDNNTYRALTGFDINAKPVKYYLQITADGGNDGVTQIRYPFYLQKAVYQSGKVFLPKQKEGLLKPSKQKEEETKALWKILSRASQEALWESSFIPPVSNPVVISGFGKRRIYYVDGLFTFIRFHRGIDFKGKRGDPVFSPNRGAVVFADRRITTGTTLVLDHGQGIFSLFFHLDSIDVKVGETVRKGEKIGTIGSTGIAAGPHLHWGLFINGVYVDPSDWQKRVF